MLGIIRHHVKEKKGNLERMDIFVAYFSGFRSEKKETSSLPSFSPICPANLVEVEEAVVGEH